MLQTSQGLPIRAVIQNLPGSRIREVADEGFRRPDAIALWFGEGNRPTAGFICDAAVAAMRDGKTFYTENRGIPGLREDVARYVSELRGVDIAPDRISVTPSGVNAIMAAMQCLVEPGTNVVLLAPVWPNCADAVEVMGGELRRIALTRTETGWSLDLDRLEQLCDAGTRAIFVNSPSNPTGWMASRADIEALLDISRRHGCWLMMDEVYERLVYEGEVAPSVLDIARPDDLVISLNSFSKAWNMTGWRLGWMVAPAWFGEQMAKVLEINMSCSPPFVQQAGRVALSQGEHVVRENLAHYRSNRDLVVAALSGRPGITFAPPPATFYAWMQVAGISDSLAFAKRLLAETGVGLAPGVAFGPEGEGWLRLCFASDPARLETALDRLVGFLSQQEKA